MIANAINYGTIIAVPDKTSGDAINFYTYE